MGDLISRQAVLNLLATMPPEEAITKAMLIQSVQQMDAAQPDGPDNLVKDSQGLAKDLVNDCISRQAAIEAVKKNTFRLTFAEEQNCEGHLAWSANAVYSDVIEGALLELPSAQPETTERTTETAQNVSDRDLISRKAAIDAIRASTSKYTGFMEMEMYTDDDAVEAIEALPSVQPEQQWIPCKERLPEDGQKVLVTYKTTDKIHPCQYHDDGSRNPWYSYIDQCRAHMNVVVAWMPLPEPYKEDDYDHT